MKTSFKGSTFLFITCFASAIILVLIVLLNMWINIFGLFGDTKGEKVEIYHDEKVSKYLLAHNYIPQNFNGLLIGPSLSDNLDVSYLSDENITYYNLSVMGANIFELAAILEKSMEYGHITSVIICLNPYLTKDTGSKGTTLDEKLYYGAFGSYNLYQTYVVKLIRESNIMSSKYQKNQFSWNGTNNYDEMFRVDDVKKRIEEEVEVQLTKSIQIEEVAVKKLKTVIDRLTSEGIKVTGYFHPIPEDLLKASESDYLEYQVMIQRLFTDNQTVIDFNSNQFRSIRVNYENFIDHGHLSKQGQLLVLQEIKKELKN